MDIFSVLTLFGGLAMFLYGMRLMGDGLKESSSGTLKMAMESVTNNVWKAFLLGMIVTAIIQSSTATIVITAGLVAAGVISFHQSLGIIVGANVGTTITGQIIRLLDIDASSGSVLQLFKPSTLAPVALIIGIVMIMTDRLKNSKTLGNIAIGFGILFTGLMSMTDAVDSLGQTGIFENLFASMGNNPLIGYLTGAGIAFVLQSSSATIGILQAFSASGQLLFKAVYSVIIGVWLGDCVTTGIVCWIGAKANAKRVGIMNILFNLAKTALTLIVMTIIRYTGVLDSLFETTVNSGIIANTNSIFNLASAIILMPGLGLLEKASLKIVEDDPVEPNPYQEKLDALNPQFVKTPAIALNSCYEMLGTMFDIARANIEGSLGLIHEYSDDKAKEILKKEDDLDFLTDSLGNYLAELSANLRTDQHVVILNQYYKLVTAFERMGDYAINITRTARDMHKKKIVFSEYALKEVDLLQEVLTQVLDRAEMSFRKRNLSAAYHVEPLEEVIDDMVQVMKNRHLVRLSKGLCNTYAGTDFMDMLSSVERISDLCSDVALATITRVYPELANQSHEYIVMVHSGKDEQFNREYKAAHDRYVSRLNDMIKPEDQQETQPA